MTPKIVLTSFIAAASVASVLSGQTTTWTAVTTPVQATITGGPWTLANGPLTNPIAAGNYCPSGTALNATSGSSANSGSNLFQPYYFPFITGRGLALHGYFDYRPHDVNEAVVAATSADGGLTWTVQQMAEQLTVACPGPNTGTSASKIATDNSASANGNDAGLGHPHIIPIGGATFLY